MKRCVFAALTALMLFSAVEMAARTDRGRQMGPRESRAEGIGITFGYVNSSYKATDWATDEVERAPALNGFTASLTKDFTLVRSVLYLQTGLGYVYQTRTRNSEAEFPGGLVRTKVIMDRTEHFMTLPVRLKYTLPLFGRIGVSVDAGPVFLAGLSSKMPLPCLRIMICTAGNSRLRELRKEWTRSSGLRRTEAFRREGSKGSMSCSAQVSGLISSVCWK